MLKKKPPFLQVASKNPSPEDLKAMVANQIDKAKKHNYKYINPEAVKNIVGRWAPLSVWNFSFLLECFVGVLDESGSSIMNSKGTYKTDIEGVPEALKGVGEKLLRSNKRYISGCNRSDPPSKSRPLQS
jgi:hypothetical protein